MHIILGNDCLLTLDLFKYPRKTRPVHCQPDPQFLLMLLSRRCDRDLVLGVNLLDPPLFYGLLLTALRDIDIWTKPWRQMERRSWKPLSVVDHFALLDRFLQMYGSRLRFPQGTHTPIVQVHGPPPHILDRSRRKERGIRVVLGLGCFQLVNGLRQKDPLAVHPSLGAEGIETVLFGPGVHVRVDGLALEGA